MLTKKRKKKKKNTSGKLVVQKKNIPYAGQEPVNELDYQHRVCFCLDEQRYQRYLKSYLIPLIFLFLDFFLIKYALRRRAVRIKM